MNTEWLIDHYNWQALLLYFAGLVAISVVLKKVAFRIPTIKRVRELNRREDKVKLAIPKYKPAVKKTGTVSLYMYPPFLLLVVPFILTLDTQPTWLVVANIAAIILLYDFIYYCTHLFMFHGNGPLRKVHGLHHQAREISAIDGLYVHPLETAIGNFIFMVALIVPVFFFGKAHAVTFLIAHYLHISLNQLAHCKIDLNYLPYKPFSYMAAKHATHHLDMHRGNYATQTPVFDWLFRTLQ